MTGERLNFLGGSFMHSFHTQTVLVSGRSADLVWTSRRLRFLSPQDYGCGVASLFTLPDQIALMVSSWPNPCGTASLRVLA